MEVKVGSMQPLVTNPLIGRGVEFWIGARMWDDRPHSMEQSILLRPLRVESEWKGLLRSQSHSITSIPASPQCCGSLSFFCLSHSFLFFVAWTLENLQQLHLSPRSFLPKHQNAQYWSENPWYLEDRPKKVPPLADWSTHSSSRFFLSHHNCAGNGDKWYLTCRCATIGVLVSLSLLRPKYLTRTI